MIESHQPRPNTARKARNREAGPAAPRSGGILVVGDRVSIAESLAAALGDLGLPVATMAEPGLDGTPPSPPESGRSVAVLDAGLGAPGEAPALTRALAGAGWLVLVLAAPADPLTTAACLEAGAAGYLPAQAPLGAVGAAVEDLCAGRAVGGGTPDREYLLAMLREARTTSARLLQPFGRLTRREQEVLGGLIDGLRPEQIAEAGFVSPTTVRNQIQSVLTKLGVRSRLEAVALARRSGWLPELDD